MFDKLILADKGNAISNEEVTISDKKAVAKSQPLETPDISTRRKPRRHRLLAIAGLVALIAILIVTGSIGYRAYQNHLMKEGMTDFGREMNTIATTGKVDSRIYSKDKYAVLERLTKERLTSVVSHKTTYIASLTQIKESLELGTYLADDPDLTKHSQNIEDTTKAAGYYFGMLKTFSDSFTGTKSQASSISYIQKALYKVAGVQNGQSLDDFLSVGRSSQENLENTSQQLFAFLKQNQNAWKIENGSVVFGSPALSQQYTTLKTNANSAVSKALSSVGE